MAGLRQSLREAVAKRSSHRCEYCLCPESHSPAPFSAEHVQPVSLGGASVASNLAWSCQGCNNHKFTSVTGVDPATGRDVPLYHPRDDTWTEHFSWNEEHDQLIGLSGTGRATIERLKLNRPAVCRLRRALKVIGAHPPDSERLRP